jgi:hypothetical protein
MLGILANYLPIGHTLTGTPRAPHFAEQLFAEGQREEYFLMIQAPSQSRRLRAVCNCIAFTGRARITDDYPA